MALQLSNYQYDRLMDVYQTMRFDAERSARENTALAYSRIPGLKLLDKEMVRAFYKSNSKEIGAIASDIESKKRGLLRENGFPEDFLNVKYNCSYCKDTGFENGERCRCFKGMITRLIYGEIRWERLKLMENFSHFDLGFYENDPKAYESAKKALSISKDFAANIISGKPQELNNLIITGDTGVGKTFLTNCIAKELIENDLFVVFLSAPTLFEIFEMVTFPEKKPSGGYSGEAMSIHYSNLFDCDLLIIDDLGTEFATSATSPKLLELINKRLLSNLPTVISTNLSLSELARLYSERLLSRITGDYQFIHLFGDDIRQQKRRTPKKRGA